MPQKRLEDLHDLAELDPVVYACFAQYRYGHVDREGCLVAMVESLHKALTDTREQVIKLAGEAGVVVFPPDIVCRSAEFAASSRSAADFLERNREDIEALAREQLACGVHDAFKISCPQCQEANEAVQKTPEPRPECNRCGGIGTVSDGQSAFAPLCQVCGGRGFI